MVEGILKRLENEKWDDIRADIVDKFAAEEYGIVPDGWNMKYEFLENIKADGVDGKTYEITISFEDRILKFPFVLWLPKDVKKPVPCTLLINCWPKEESAFEMPEEMRNSYIENVKRLLENDAHFMDFINSMMHADPVNHLDITKDINTGKWPVKMITERGFATASFYLADLMPDGIGNNAAGILPLFYEGKEIPNTAPGGIAAWAFGAKRVLDVLSELNEIDGNRVYVAGHSRTGKAAMWATASDERFAGAFINNSGCCGAAINDGKLGERYTTMIDTLSNWFCPNFAKYKDVDVKDMPFDQDELLAAIAPRTALVTSGSVDWWSDPIAEFKGVKSAGKVYEALKVYGYDTGKCNCDIYPDTNSSYLEGTIGYALRYGGHDMTKWDWEQFLNMISRN